MPGSTNSQLRKGRVPGQKPYIHDTSTHCGLHRDGLLRFAAETSFSVLLPEILARAPGAGGGGRDPTANPRGPRQNRPEWRSTDFPREARASTTIRPRCASLASSLSPRAREPSENWPGSQSPPPSLSRRGGMAVPPTGKSRQNTRGRRAPSYGLNGTVHTEYINTRALVRHTPIHLSTGANTHERTALTERIASSRAAYRTRKWIAMSIPGPLRERGGRGRRVVVVLSIHVGPPRAMRNDRHLRCTALRIAELRPTWVGGLE